MRVREIAEVNAGYSDGVTSSGVSCLISIYKNPWYDLSDDSHDTRVAYYFSFDWDKGDTRDFPIYGAKYDLWMGGEFTVQGNVLTFTEYKGGQIIRSANFEFDSQTLKFKKITYSNSNSVCTVTTR